MVKKSVIDPIFIISLDVELLWGAVLHPKNKDVSLLLNDEKKGRGTIDLLLSLFEEYNIPATWAFVGHLFLDRCQKENGVPHQGMPRFKDGWYCIDPCSDIQQDPLYYGRDIIEKVRSSPVGHEIGYHSFSHVPFSDCSREVAEAEIKEGVRAASELGIVLRSFVFPYNLVGHVDILMENGFEIYRGNSAIPWNMKMTLLIRKVAGALNLLLAPPVEPRRVHGIWEIRSSTFFMGCGFPRLLLPRTKMGLYWAILSKRVFHIFLHPHNLLTEPSIGRELDKLLAFVSKTRDEGKLVVMTMGELASYLNSHRGI
jgi:hypothetical protein